MRRIPKPSRGFTLIELLVALLVLGVLSSLAFPSFMQTFVRFRLEGAVNELSTDVQYTRAEALRRREVATLAVDAGGTSYTIKAGAANTVLKTVSMPSGITLTPDAAVSFENLTGTASSVSFLGQATAYSLKLRVDVDALGRIKLCAPASSGLQGYPSC
jgi:prepilin-type N-terminal cleavage/methylation domain-containing protein